MSRYECPQETRRRLRIALLLGGRPASHVFDFLAGHVFQLAGLVDGFVTHLARLLFGAHVSRPFGGLETWCRLELLLGERYRNNPLARGVRRECERAKRYGDALLSHSEEATHTDHRRGYAAGLVEQQIIDVADILAGLIGHRLADKSTCQPLALRLYRHKRGICSCSGRRRRLSESGGGSKYHNRGERRDDSGFHTGSFEVMAAMCERVRGCRRGRSAIGASALTVNQTRRLPMKERAGGRTCIWRMMLCTSLEEAFGSGLVRFRTLSAPASSGLYTA